MAKFRKKPVVIEAVHWNGQNHKDVWALCPAAELHNAPQEHVSSQRWMEIHTREGNMIASVGDWIIKGVKGEFYPCKPDIFEATYEPVPTIHEMGVGDVACEEADLRSAAGPTADFDSRLAAVKALSFLGIVAKDSEIAALQGLFHGAFVAGTEAAKEHLASAAGTGEASLAQEREKLLDAYYQDQGVAPDGELRPLVSKLLKRVEVAEALASRRGPSAESIIAWEAIKIVENEPLGYLTERDHEVLENFADRVVAKLWLAAEPVAATDARLTQGILREDVSSEQLTRDEQRHKPSIPESDPAVGKEGMGALPATWERDAANEIWKFDASGAWQDSKEAWIAKVVSIISKWVALRSAAGPGGASGSA